MNRQNRKYPGYLTDEEFDKHMLKEYPDSFYSTRLKLVMAVIELKAALYAFFKSACCRIEIFIKTRLY